jgi:small-conductance mechanosensitive channel
VGLKTTRIRSLGGEQIIFSNAELLKNRIRNFKRMQERRVVYEFGIAYETPVEQVEQIPLLVKQIITSNSAAIRFDRAHFKGYGESALLFEAVYIVLDPDFNKHMDIQQDINLSLLREFRKRGVAFAHPSRTVYLNTAPQRRSAEKTGGTPHVVVIDDAPATEQRTGQMPEPWTARAQAMRAPD